MRRPASTRETLGRSPVVEARWAHSSGIERVPLMSARAEPVVFLAGRPAALRAADARRSRRAEFLLFFKLAIQNHERLGNVIQESTTPARRKTDSEPRVPRK